LEIILAKTAGFCFGVNRAIEMALDCAQKNKDAHIYSLGHIIHNKQVVEELSNKGIKVVEDIKEAKECDILIIRAHGVGPEIYEQIKLKNLQMIDTTCPFVKKIHDKVVEFGNEGRSVVIVGDKEHPEVIGIKGWNKNAVVINSEQEAEEIKGSKDLAVAAQTTLSKEKWQSICRILEENNPECKICNTICNATSERQDEAVQIAKKADVMVVIGDTKSSNTKKLYEISKKICDKTFLIENARQFDMKVLEGQNIIGITAGASTPDSIIKEVVLKMSEVNQMEEELSFAELFEGSVKSIEEGEIIKGKIINITNKELHVDLGYKADGIIPFSEFSDNLEEKASEMYKSGDEIEALVLKLNDGEGNVLLSRKRIEYSKGLEKVEEAYKNGEALEGVIGEVVNGGVIAVVKGVRVFIPASQIGIRFINDLNELKNKPVRFKIIEFNPQKKKVIGSQKVILEQERAVTREKLFNEITEGQILKGVVKKITDFGVFVDLGGLDGLVHISELSWQKIKHPSEVVKEGQEIEVKVMKIDKEKNKISVSYKESMENPWDKAIEKYQPGQVISGKVVSMMPFGAFIEMEMGVTGLVHISHIAERRIKRPEDALTLGQAVEAKIISIDVQSKKISLSIKELENSTIEEV
jgi:4-hydroxy-3-methylbut-2-enyl diphosphate reductase